MAPAFQSARSRQALLWTALSFLFFQLSTGILLDYAYPQIRFGTAEYLFTALATRPTPDVIALGSSRIGLAFHSTEVGNLLRASLPREDLRVMNLAVPSGDPRTSFCLLERLLADGHRPRLVVVEVCPEELNAHNDWFGYDISRLLRWHDVPTAIPEAIQSGTVRRLLTHRLFPLCIYRDEIRRYCFPARTGPLLSEMASPTVLLKSDQSGIDSQGLWGDVIEAHRGLGEPAGPADTREGLGHLRRWLRRYEAGGAPLAALQHLLRRCRAEGIGVVLVGIPFHSDHRREYTPAIEAAFLEAMAHFQREFGCTFLDYRAGLEDRVFFDNAHVYPVGGSQFSAQLAREVLLPALRERR